MFASKYARAFGRCRTNKASKLLGNKQEKKRRQNASKTSCENILTNHVAICTLPIVSLSAFPSPLAE